MKFSLKEEKEIEEENNNSNENIISKIIYIVIILAAALIVGLTIFLIANAIFNKKPTTPKKPVNTTEKLDLNNQNVKTLYKYVTTGTNNIRVDKFVKNSKVDKTSFTDEEKLYYALQFAEVKDFENFGDLDEQGNKIYNISKDKIKKYLTLFFGNGVTLSEYVPIEYVFSFKINDKNVGYLTYSDENDGYNATFTEYQDIDKKSEELVDSFYTKLVNAYKKNDGTYYLEEKVIYTDLVKENDKYKLSIYKDYNKEQLIESKTTTESELKENPIKIEDYLDKASTITYVFKANTLNKNTLYFDSSSIKTK